MQRLQAQQGATAHPMLFSEQVVQDLGDGEGDDAHSVDKDVHKPRRVRADRQPIARAQRLWNDLTCITHVGLHCCQLSWPVLGLYASLYMY